MSDKSEEPTPKRLRDARQKGQVAKSNDVTSAALLVVIFAVLGMAWEPALRSLREMLLLPAGFYNVPFEEALPAVLTGVLVKLVTLGYPLLLLAAAVGIAANVAQVGPLLVFEPLKPDLNKFNPAEGIKKIFSIKNLVEFLKSVLKVAFLAILLYSVIKNSIEPLLKLPYAGLDGVLALLGPLMKTFAINVGLAYTVVAAADYFFQKKQHTKGLRMSKDEVKREFKEMEGNPEIKGKRKQLHREMVMNDTVQKTRKATVLVTNPTHYAIAIVYDGGEETKLPIVLAKGEGFLAKRMIEVAQEENIPIMRNVPLAHALFEQVEMDQYIPTDLLEPVAEVLRWVQSLKNAS